MDLTRNTIINLLRRNYVPVASSPGSLAKMTAAGLIDPLPRGVTAFYVLNHDGKLIMGETKGIGGDALTNFLVSGIQKYGSITPRDPAEPVELSPFWGEGVADDKARVGLFFRLVGTNTEYRVWNLDLKYLRAIAPSKPTAGIAYPLPDPVIRELLPVMGYVPPWIPNTVRANKVTATVTSVTDTGIEVTIAGSLAGQYNNGQRSEGRLDGLLRFTRNGQPAEFMLISRGSYDAGWGPYKIEGLMEWQASAESAAVTSITQRSR